jgi:hypothetical protein
MFLFRYLGPCTDLGSFYMQRGDLLGLRLPGLMVLELNLYSNIQTEEFEVAFFPCMLAK